MTVQQWVDAYAQAWRDRDADAAANLFTDDCLYRDHPLQNAHRGAEGVSDRLSMAIRCLHRSVEPPRRSEDPVRAHLTARE